MPNIVANLYTEMKFLFYCGHVYFSSTLVIVLLLWLRHIFEVNEGLSSYMWWWNQYSWHNYFVTTIKFLAKLKMCWTKCPRCNKLPWNYCLLLQYKLLPQTLCLAIGRVYHQQWRIAFFIYYHQQWFVAFYINYHQQWVIVFSIYYQQQCFIAFSIYYHQQWFVAFSIYCSQQWFIAFPIYYHQQMNVAIVTLATKFVMLQDFVDAIEHTAWQYGHIPT